KGKCSGTGEWLAPWEREGVRGGGRSRSPPPPPELRRGVWWGGRRRRQGTGVKQLFFYSSV
uniref:Uncharacterized protein n=1 Tax=Aegilops tauschii subsp. strangulata TaxID=200361 RepID=A0A453DPD6_AEGTS